MRVFLSLALVASAFLIAGPAASQDIKGQGRVIDNVRLWVGHTKVRLCGLAPAPSGPPRNLMPRGMPPKTLRDLTQHKTVACVRVGNGTPCDGRMPVVDFGHVVAQCFVDGVDVASSLICFGNQQPDIMLAGQHYQPYLQGFANARSACNRLR